MLALACATVNVDDVITKRVDPIKPLTQKHRAECVAIVSERWEAAKREHRAALYIRIAIGTIVGGVLGILSTEINAGADVNRGAAFAAGAAAGIAALALPIVGDAGEERELIARECLEHRGYKVLF